MNVTNHDLILIFLTILNPRLLQDTALEVVRRKLGLEETEKKQKNGEQNNG